MSRYQIHHFEFNGQDSRDFNVYITSKTVYDSPERDNSLQSVPGRSGDLIISNGRVKNQNFKLGLRVFTSNNGSDQSSDFSFDLQRIKDWLLPDDDKYHEYSDSYDPDYYKLVVPTSGISVKQRYSDVADLEISFSSKPYKRSYGGNQAIEFTATGTLFNYENASALPLIRVYPSGNYTAENKSRFAINGIVYSIYGVNGYVDIDSESMTAYKSTTSFESKFASSDNSYPILKSGSNTITLMERMTKLVITPRWRARV